MIFILDVSSWNTPSTVPWQLLWDLGFRVVIVKASMGGGYDRLTDEHVRLAREHGFIIGLYHWVDPIQSWSRQTEYFKNRIYKYEPALAAYDVEQWWADWAKWQLYVQGKLANSKVPRTTAARVVDSYLTVRSRTLEAFPDILHWTYTGSWFTAMWTGLAEAMLGHDIWIADYNLSRTIVHSRYGGNFRLTAEQWTAWAEELMDELRDGAYDGVPLMPKGHGAPVAWQVDSSVHPPGSPTRLDLVIFNGTEGDFARLFKLEPEPAPEPEPEPEPEPTPADIPARVLTLEMDMAEVELSVASLDAWARTQGYDGGG